MKRTPDGWSRPGFAEQNNYYTSIIRRRTEEIKMKLYELTEQYAALQDMAYDPVSYTHLTLPTKA